jgi:uncharacterized protein YkwD
MRWWVVVFLLAAATAQAGEPEPKSAPKSAAAPWAETVRAPHPLAGLADPDLYARCGAPDAALVRVAAAVVRLRAEGKAPPHALVLGELVRAAGAPYVGPRAWSLAGDDDAQIAARLGRWVGAGPGLPARCGIARGAAPDGTPLIAAVAAPAPADLEPLPSRARSGQWLALEARLRVAADDAKVVLLGPRGRPRRVLASMSGGVVRSRFALDQPGRWLVQVVADLDEGPRPVIEATVFVDVAPTPDRASPTVRVAQGPLGLMALLDGARRAEGLTPLVRDAALDRLALEHAQRMARRGHVAHDAGDGSPAERVERAGIEAARVGENVGSAPTVERIHHALWRSPSHRENMLHPHHRRLGIAVVDRGGRLFAAQIFAD